MCGPPDKRSARPRQGSSASKEIALGSGDRAQDTARDPFTQPDHLLAEWLATPSLNSRQRRQLEDLGVIRVRRLLDCELEQIPTTGQVLTFEIDRRLVQLINLLDGKDEDRRPLKVVKE